MLQQLTVLSPVPVPPGMTHHLYEWGSRDPLTVGIGKWLQDLGASKFGTYRVLTVTHNYVPESVTVGSAYRSLRIWFFKKTNAKKNARYFEGDATFCIEALVVKKTGQVVLVDLWAQTLRPKLPTWVSKAALAYKMAAP